MRHYFVALVLVVSGCAPSSAPPEPSPSSERPNFVVVLVDDMRWDDIGAGGHPFVETPNIDRIAKEGAQFTNAFTTTPLCSPARASFLTGLYAHAHGITDNLARKRSEPSAADVSESAPRERLPNGVHRQVAHGERRQPASRVRPVGRDARSRRGGRPAPQHRRHPDRDRRLRHRPSDGLHRRVHGSGRRRAVSRVGVAQSASPQHHAT